MYNHNKAQQSKNRVHISWDILYVSNELGHPVVYVLYETDNLGLKQRENDINHNTTVWI